MNRSTTNYGAFATWLLLATTALMAVTPSRSLAAEDDPFAEQTITKDQSPADGDSSPRPILIQEDALADSAQRMLTHMKSQVATLKARFWELRENHGADHPEVQQVKALLDSSQAVLAALEARASDPETVRKAHEQMVAKLREAQSKGEIQQDNVSFQSALAEAQRQVAIRDEQISQLSRQLFNKNEQDSRLPPLKNAEIKIFHLLHAAPQDLAKVIDSIFSPAQLRLSIDERTKSLVVMGDKESLGIVEALLTQMDRPADGAADKDAPKAAAAEKSGNRSLLLRVFWLADGLPEDEGQDPAAYLPESVLQALDRLGLKAPRLVTQTVNSVAVGSANNLDYRFATSVPAVVDSQPTTVNCRGSMKPIVAERSGLDMYIEVSGPSVQCHLEGSLATPLGHYMVLGTANSLSADPAQAARTPGGEMRGAMEVGPEGGMGLMEKRARPTFNQARFAFVVQVIEATSYPAEKSE